jgi:ribosomal protein S18 acetylase RimI-like enzyme
MYTRLVQPPHGPLLTVRPLRDGDVDTVLAVFERLSDASRRARFHGPKPCLSARELRLLAAVDERHHALVAYVDGDPRPVAIARLARESRTSAEIAFAVADEHQHHGIGSALAAELICDARAAGITEITALAANDNPAALALLRRTTNVVAVTPEGSALSIRAAIA